MSNNNRPPLSLPNKAPPPLPPNGLPPQFTALLTRYPLPWVVGPRGDIWVAADVETFNPDKEVSTERVPGPNGTFWRTTEACRLTIGRPRLVAETSEMVDTDRDMSAFIVFVANKLAR